MQHQSGRIQGARFASHALCTLIIYRAMPAVKQHMSRGRSKRAGRFARSKQLPLWASAAPDGTEKAYIQLGLSLLTDKRYQALNGGAKHVYACMLSEARGSREFIFPKSAAKRYGISPSSLGRHVKELQAAGFIELASSGKVTREPNNYRFSLAWKDGAA